MMPVGTDIIAKLEYWREIVINEHKNGIQEGRKSYQKAN